MQTLVWVTLIVGHVDTLLIHSLTNTVHADRRAAAVHMYAETEQRQTADSPYSSIHAAVHSV